VKTGLAVAIHDVDRPEHIEMLPYIFEDTDSVKDYVSRRLNVLVTVVVCVNEILVPDQYKLLRCPAMPT
jgi:hypothetical protein